MGKFSGFKIYFCSQIKAHMKSSMETKSLHALVFLWCKKLNPSTSCQNQLKTYPKLIGGKSRKVTIHWCKCTHPFKIGDVHQSHLISFTLK